MIQLKDVEVEEHSVLIAKGVENGMFAFALPLMLKEIKKEWVFGLVVSILAVMLDI